MTNKEKARRIIGLIINLIIIGIVIYCVYIFILRIMNGNKDIKFRYFTNISNITVAIVSIIHVPYIINTLITGKEKYHPYLLVFEYVGMAMTTLTFFTILFTFPMIGLDSAYGKEKIFTHLIVPLLVIFSFLFFEEKIIFPWKYSSLVLAPIIGYSVAYSINVVWLKTWPDLYGTNTNGLGYLFALLAISLGYIFAQGLYFLKKLIIKKVFHQ